MMTASSKRVALQQLLLDDNTDAMNSKNVLYAIELNRCNNYLGGFLQEAELVNG